MLAGPVSMGDRVDESGMGLPVPSSGRRVPHAVALLMLAWSGCQDSALSPCDPLGDMPQPIALGEVIAVGRDGEGTLYVADEAGADGEARVFVSVGDGLVRRRVSGSGAGRDSDVEFRSFTVEGMGGPFRWLIERTVDETQMAIAPVGENRATRIDELGPEAELLEVLDENAIEGLVVRNFRGAIEVEYLAETEDDALLLVIRPADDWGYEDFRLFYGREERLLEREVTDVRRQRDGGTTHIEFELSGEHAVAFFPVRLGAPEPQQATLTIGNETEPLARRDDELPDDAGFLCLDD
jgi:hypothetical protein